MFIRKKPAANERIASKLVIGRERFATISVVKGITPTAAYEEAVGPV